MSGRANILFVDDEKRVLNSMRGLFRRDFELFLTTEGANAVQIATENSIDVIVADQRMPGMTGIEVLGKVKELSPRTVRILLTGYADPEAVEGSINIGEVFRFLSKPCPPKVLRETLELAIAASRAEPVLLDTPVTTAAETPTPSTAEMLAETTPDLAAEIHTAQRPAPSAPVPVPGPAPAPAPIATQTPATPLRSVDAPPQAPATSAPQPPGPTETETPTHWQSRTEIVLSGDSSQINRSLDAGTFATATTKDVGVVVFTIDSQFAETAMRAVSADRNTILATTLGKVAEAIEQKQAGVLITDFTTNRAVLHKMIGVLKQQLPELVTIVVSNSRDTTDMISLINQGQVFRYILKPIETQSLRNDVTAAASRHQHLLKNPTALKRHEVEGTSGQTESSPTLDQFVSRIEKLRTRRSDTNG